MIGDKYNLVFQNQSEEQGRKCKVVRETAMYLFLVEEKNPLFIERVHKKTLNVKMIKEGKDGYRFDSPKAMFLKKIK